MRRHQPSLRCLLVLSALLLTLSTQQVIAQPAGGNPSTARGAASGGPRKLIAASLFVDDDNASQQDGSTLHPFKTVQQAIDAAKPNAVIAVASGTYPQNIRVQEKAVRLYAGFRREKEKGQDSITV